MGSPGNEIVELERRFWLEGGASPAFWEEHFADDGIVVLAFGQLDKQETLEAMAAGDPWRSVTMDDIREFVLGTDAFALAYRARAERDTDPGPYEAGVTSVYTRRADGWRLVLHQQTPVA